MTGRVGRKGLVSSDADEGVRELFGERYQASVRLAFVVTAHSGIAEEIAQEAFVRTWRNWDKLRDTDAAAAYLRATIMNLARSSLRRRALEMRHRGRVTDSIDRDAVLRIDLIRALQQLPPKQRACVALRYFEDLSEEETAQVLDIAKGTVKSQTHKALRKLEGMLGESHGS